MRKRGPRSGIFRDTMSLAGWLFADLLLGLAMLFFVFNTVGTKPTPPPHPTYTPLPTYTPVPTQTPRPTYTPLAPQRPASTYTPLPTYTPVPTYTPLPTPQREGVEQVAETFTLEAGRDKAEQIRELFAPFEGERRAGFVLIFGNAPTIEAGNDLARETEQLLPQVVPAVFGEAGMKALHYVREDGAREGDVDLEIYFLVGVP